MLTYQDCLELIRKGRGGRKKLENNTYLSQSETGAFMVVLHNTAVVTIFPNNTYKIKTGGWQTVTTKARINAYSPAGLHSKKGTWYVGNGELFQNDMVLDVNGRQTQSSRNEMAVEVAS